MIDRRNVLNSAGMTVLNVGISACTMFVLYKFLLSSIGVEKVGIWALVLAATSITRISELGVSGSVVKFVSKYLVLEKPEKAGSVIQTAVITIACVTALVLMAARPLIDWGLSFFITGDALRLANEIIPYALFSLWTSMVVSVLFSSLDGCQRIDLRNGITILGNILYLPTAVLLVLKDGLIGLAYAQVLQSCFLLLVAWVVLRRSLAALPALPNHWDKTIFKEILGYSVGLQITGVLALLIEPLTKALLSKYGGLGMLGYFEMATRMISQFRSLLVSVNQIIVPVIARLHEVSPGQIKDAYLLSYRLLFYVSLPAYAGLFAMIPMISELWIGWFEQKFVTLAMIVTVGAFLNSLVNPAYFVNLARGKLFNNMSGYLVMSLLNGMFGYILGRAFGGIGVALAYVIAMSIGSWVILVAFHVGQSIPLSVLLPLESRKLAAFSAIAAALTLALYFLLAVHANAMLLLVCSFLVFLTTIMLPMWNHPIRKQLAGWVGKRA